MKKAAVNVVSDDDAREFERYLRRWQGILNLNDWRIHLMAKRDLTNAAALDKAELPHRFAKFKLGADLGPEMPVTPFSLEHLALHEMLHLFLAELIETTIAEREHNDTVLGAEHAVVIILTDLLMAVRGENA